MAINRAQNNNLHIDITIISFALNITQRLQPVVLPLSPLQRLRLSPPRSPRSIYTDVNHIFRKELFKKNLGVGRTYLFARLGDLLRKCLKPNRPFHKHRLLFEVDIKLAHLACSNGTIVSHKTGYIV